MFIELPIALSWKNWGAWEAMRDLLQNTLDAGDRGDKISVTRGGGKGLITLKNSGSHLTREDLVLGHTSKADRNSRGHKGEGFKIALATLTRLGCKISIASGAEVWTPIVGKSKSFGKAEILMIETRSRDFANETTIKIDGFSGEAWNDVLARIIDDRVMGALTPVKTINTLEGSILLDPTCAGKVFVGGLWVCDLRDENAAYGYNFHPRAIELDSDRKLADPYSLRYAVAKMFDGITGQVDTSKLYDLLRTEGFESRAIASHGWATGALDVVIAEEHKRRTGSDLACATNDEANKAAHVGLAVPVVGSAIASLVSRINPLDRAIETRARGPKRMIDRTELPSSDFATLVRAEDTLRTAGLVFATVEPVEFWRTSTMGEAQGSVIRIAVHVLGSINDTVETLIHEIAHIESGAGDGTPEHQRMIEKLSAKVIVALMAK